ncbi:formimidoylglutamase [Cochleicola gelatinilyticus]|uniref:Arginase n=1 Tax=Cochleicola gelatinilyticus TaxID=1763537 RepID=A0A167HI39_9FLAO|nr:formimidoylglutamase [Cochleicola gelatinilyticus]OAB78631.1 arginase [Cochleicola gelatinilyticus]
MKTIHFFSESEYKKRINKREGETKLGEVIEVASGWDALNTSEAKYVLLGIPEDIGVRANLGKKGASEAWEATLNAFVNVQKNYYINQEGLILLGTINCDQQMKQAASISEDDTHYAEKLGELVTQIDHMVSEVIGKIVATGKIPILIGGGHNNSYGNLKGASEALTSPVNCINFDAHTDFRSLEHRHSGNGFTYAFEDGYLDRYFIFGLHRNYTSESIFEKLQKHAKRIQYILFEGISISEENTFSEALQQAETFCCNKKFGLELDLDAIENFGSSAMTPSGFTLTEARKFLSYFSKHPNCTYIHICEGAPSAGIFPNQVGKAISYLISDIVCK